MLVEIRPLQENIDENIVHNVVQEVIVVDHSINEDQPLDLTDAHSDAVPAVIGTIAVTPSRKKRKRYAYLESFWMITILALICSRHL